MIYPLIVLIVLLLAYHAWKDLKHQQHIERLELLLKAKDVPEFVAALPVTELVEEEPADDTMSLEEARPEEVLAAIKKTEQQES